MEYICNNIDDFLKASQTARQPGDIFICSYEVFEFARHGIHKSIETETMKGKPIC